MSSIIAFSEGFITVVYDLSIVFITSMKRITEIVHPAAILLLIFATAW